MDATASGAGEVQDYAQANGGAGQTTGGAASATINATSTGGLVYGQATAYGGGDTTGAGNATAIATGNAARGTLESLASSNAGGAPLIQFVTATTNLNLYGAAATAKSSTKFGGGLTSIADAGFAEGIAAPTAYNATLNANAAIKNALGPNPTIFDEGALGASHAGSATGTQTATSSVEVLVNLAGLNSAGNFVLGLFGGAITDAADVSQVTLDVTQGFFGLTMFTQSYTGAAALAAFTDGVPILSNAGFTNSGSEELAVSLTVTTTAPGAAFSGDFIFGDPPVHAAAARMSFLSPPPAASAHDFSPAPTRETYAPRMGFVAPPAPQEISASSSQINMFCQNHTLQNLMSLHHFSGH